MSPPALPPAHGWRREDLRAWLALGPPRPWRYELTGYLVDADGRRLARGMSAEVGLLVVLLANAAGPLLEALAATEHERDQAYTRLALVAEAGLPPTHAFAHLTTEDTKDAVPPARSQGDAP